MDRHKIKRYNEIILSALIVLLGIAFIFSVYHLYLSGGAVPYSRERVGEYLMWLLPLSVISVLSAILAGVISSQKEKSEDARAFISPRTLYERRISRVDLSSLSPEGARAVAYQGKKRKILLLSTLAVVLVYIIIALIFALDAGRYTIEGCSEEIAILSLILFPPALIIISASVVVNKLYQESLIAEADVYKAEYEAGCRGGGRAPSPVIAFLTKNEETLLLASRLAFVALAVALIILGVSNGTMADVLGKAIKICTECIGLG